MASTFGVLTLILASLFVFASGQINSCSDPSDENCVLKLKTLNIFNPRRRPSYRPIYRLNEVLDLSKHALTRLLLQSKTARTTNDYTTWRSSAEYTTRMPTTPDRREVVPYIDLYGITDLILSNNDVSVEELVTILYDQRDGQTHPLTFLDLGYLNITWLPDQIFQFLPNIEVLLLNNNPIGDMNFVAPAIKKLKNLKVLNISGCNLKSLVNHTSDLFEGIHLTKLDLRSNFFTTVPTLTSLSSSLTHLYIDNNPINVLDDTSFSALHVIEYISAANCSIHTVTGETFSTNFRLTKLNLRNNKIRHLFPNDINLERTIVSLENNPWDCTCRNLWLMKETLREDTILERPRKIRCSTPTLYANRTLFEAAVTVESSSNCDLLYLDFYRTPTSRDSDSFGSFMTKNAIINIFIVAGLLAIISVIATLILIKKFNYNSGLETYRPLHKILQHKDSGLLNEKNIHVIEDI